MLLPRYHLKRAPATTASRLPLAAGRTQEPDSLWDELGAGEDDDDDLFLSTGRVAAVGGFDQRLEVFKEGADFEKAKFFAATRTFAIAPWHADVTPKPIFAVSDSTGAIAERLSRLAFLQFGPSEKAEVKVLPGVQDQEAVKEVVAQAAKAAPGKALASQGKGAILVYTLASKKLGAFLEEESRKQGVPCMNLMESVLQAMEKHFKTDRSVTIQDGDRLDAFESEGMTVYAVSDSEGQTAQAVAEAALRQFPGIGVDSITVCGDVKSLKDIDDIVQEALAVEAAIVFSFGSPGMSRFMRQQCERAKVKYADAFQPLLVALERYLNYPPAGVAGGFDGQTTDFKRTEVRR